MIECFLFFVETDSSVSFTGAILSQLGKLVVFFCLYQQPMSIYNRKGDLFYHRISLVIELPFEYDFKLITHW